VHIGCISICCGYENPSKINLAKDALHGMAYYIFLKSLGSPEEFRKISNIKIPPKSPPTNFQSIGIFKNPIFIPKQIFLQLSAQSAQQPAGLLGLLAHPAQQALFLHLHHSKEPPLPPSSATLASLTMAALPRAPHCIPRLLPLLPPSFYGVKRQLRGSHFIPINTGHSSVLTTGHRPPPLAPIKGENPIVLHHTSSRSLSLLPTPKHCPHRVPPPPLVQLHRPIATPPPLYR
jgi:hypothetical protein